MDPLNKSYFRIGFWYGMILGTILSGLIASALILLTF